MNDRKRHNVRMLVRGFAMAMAVLFGGCNVFPEAGHQAGTYEGPPTSIGQGVARSYVVLDADGKPVAVGIRMSQTALLGLPAEEPAHEHGVEYLLQLPPQSAGSGYNHIGIDWNPKGHIPEGVYDTAHFDFHFYLIGQDDRQKITAVGSDLERAHKAPDAAFMPAGYVLPPGTEVPNMGAHAIDPKSDEFTGKVFTKTFIYGFYDGQLIFLEPMITKAFLETRPNDLVPIAAPKAYAHRGYYPSSYGVRYDESKHEYDISLAGLVAH